MWLAVTQIPVTQGVCKGCANVLSGAQSMGAGGPGDGLVASTLCPMHGPLVQRSLSELLRQYRYANAGLRYKLLNGGVLAPLAFVSRRRHTLLVL